MNESIIRWRCFCCGGWLFHCLAPVAVRIDGSCPALNLAQRFFFPLPKLFKHLTDAHRPYHNARNVIFLGQWTAGHFLGAFRSKVADPVRSWKSSEMPFAGKKMRGWPLWTRPNVLLIHSIVFLLIELQLILWNLLRAVRHGDHRPLRPMFTCSRSTWRSVANLLCYDLL